MNSLTALLKKMTGSFSGFAAGTVRPREQFSVARDWALSLIVAFVVLAGGAGYASLVLFAHSTDDVVEDPAGGNTVAVRRDEIDGMIEAYAKKDRDFAARLDALVEVSDPSL